MKADIQSVLIYFGALGLTLFFLWLLKKKRHLPQHINCLLIVLACLPLSILAGIRVGTGTDYYAYVRIFNVIKEQSFTTNIVYPDKELGFTILVKLLSLLSQSNAFIFGALEFITLLFVVFALYRERERMDMLGAFVVYYILFYHASYNIIRQCLAVAIFLFAITFFAKKETGRYIFWVLIASFMHLTAVIGVLFLLVLPMVGKEPDLLRTKNKVLRSWSLLYWVIVVFSPLLFPIALRLVLQIPFLSAYSSYVVQTAQWGLGTIVFFLLFSVPIFVFGSSEQFDSVNVYFHLFALYFPISQMGYYAEWASRLNMYPLICFIPMIGTFVRQKKGTTRSLCVAYYTVLLAFTYINDILVKNFHGTFPYMWG